MIRWMKEKKKENQLKMPVDQSLINGRVQKLDLPS